VKNLVRLLLSIGFMSIGSVSAQAQQQALTNLQTYSGVGSIATSCSTCHSTIPSLNSFGSAFLGLGGSKSAYVLSATAQSTLFAADTDGDGTNNLAELQAGTNPAGASTSSSGSASTTGCITSTLTTPAALLFLLMLVGFMIRRKLEVKVK